MMVPQKVKGEKEETYVDLNVVRFNRDACILTVRWLFFRSNPLSDTVFPLSGASG